MRSRILGPDGWLTFQEYVVREKAQVEVRAVDYAGAAAAAPAPGVLDAIAAADAVLVCPSNPITSVGPILAVPGLVEALGATPANVVAVSPIVGGAAVSGPAGRLMASARHMVEHFHETPVQRTAASTGPAQPRWHA